MKKIFLILFALVFSMSICSAYKATPLSTGIVINDNNEVIGVNLDGPAYIAGIRPGNKIVNITKEGTPLEKNNKSLYDISGVLTIRFDSNGKIITTDIKTEKLLKDARISTFVVKGDKNELYKNLLRALMFDKDISGILPVVSKDTDLLSVTTLGTVSKKNVKKFPDYVVSVGGSGFGFNELETKGSFAITDIPDTDFCIVKASLNYRASYSHLFGVSWDSFSSSGELERIVIEKIFKPNIM